MLLNSNGKEAVKDQFGTHGYGIFHTMQYHVWEVTNEFLITDTDVKVWLQSLMDETKASRIWANVNVIIILV